jgi:hypothetical protein
VHQIIVTAIAVAALLPLVAACQKYPDEPPAGELVDAESCDCEEPCPDCICEKEGEAPAGGTAVESEGEGESPGGP